MINSSSDSFLLTSPLLYQNVDGSFFMQTLFDSAAAISSGILEQDVVVQIGELTLLGNGTLSFSELAAGVSQYDLLAGTVARSCPGGALGPAADFALGNRAIPEPSSVSLVGIAVGLVAFFKPRG